MDFSGAKLKICAFESGDATVAFGNPDRLKLLGQISLWRTGQLPVTV
jgi:hypothetical protein